MKGYVGITKSEATFKLIQSHGPVAGAIGRQKPKVFIQNRLEISLDDRLANGVGITAAIALDKD